MNNYTTRPTFSAEEVGRALRKLRNSHNISVSELSVLLESRYGIAVHEKTIYNWESGQYYSSAQPLIAIMDLYQTSNFADLIDGFAIPTKEIPLTDRERKLLSAYRQHAELQNTVDAILGISDAPVGENGDCFGEAGFWEE